MRYFAVRNQLDGTVVVGEQFRGDVVRVVSVSRAVDTYDAFDVTGDCAHIVRYHHDGHAVVQRGQDIIKFRSEERRVGKECAI